MTLWNLRNWEALQSIFFQIFPLLQQHHGTPTTCLSLWNVSSPIMVLPMPQIQFVQTIVSCDWKSSSFVSFHHVIQLILPRYLSASNTVWSAKFTIFLCHFLVSLVNWNTYTHFVDILQDSQLEHINTLSGNSARESIGTHKHTL